MLCVKLCENGVNPEALAGAVKHIRQEADKHVSGVAKCLKDRGEGGECVYASACMRVRVCECMYASA